MSEEKQNKDMHEDDVKIGEERNVIGFVKEKLT